MAPLIPKKPQVMRTHSHIYLTFASMRHLAVISMLLLIRSTTLYGQAPAPTGGDACGYRWYTTQANVPDSTPTYNWVDISSTGQLLSGLGDDNYVGPINLPFPFVYYWNTYSKIYVGSNGYITFGRGHNVSSGLPPYFNRFPNAAAPNEWIGVYLSDLTFTDVNGNPVPGAKLLYGTDANGRFVITWDSVPYWNRNAPGEWQGRNSFQIILDPSDSSITLQYKLIDAGYNSSYGNGNYNVVGMENITGQSGLDIAAAWGPVPFQNFAIKIWHPRNFTCSSTDAQLEWVLNSDGLGQFALKGGSAPTFQAGVLNTGNQPISANIRNILNVRGPAPSNTIIHRDTVFIPAPAIGQIATANFTKPFNHNTRGTPSNLSTGSYNCIVTLNFSGDGFAGNNSNSSELVICDTLPGGRYILRYDDGTWNPQNEDAGGLAFANGMAIVAPEDLAVEAVSFDMLYKEGGANLYPIVVWVYPYNPTTGAVGQALDTLTLAPTDFPSGDSLNTFTNQNNDIFRLRRYTLPLQNPISLQAGNGLVVGFKTDFPASATNVDNFIVEDASVPISRASFEGIAGLWAPYRDRENVEYAIGVVARRPTPSGVASAQLPHWNFLAYPNPASEAPILRFSLPQPGPVHLRLIDLTGRTLYEETLTPTTTEFKKVLPLRPATGVYFLSATYQGSTITHRLVME
jgi:hypothetical protein